MGFGYASMLSILKAMNSGAGKQQQAQHHNGAAAQAKCDEGFEHRDSRHFIVRLMVGAYCSMSAQKHGAVRYGQFSRAAIRRESEPVVFPQAGLDDSLHKMAAVGGHPGRHRAVGFAHHAIGGMATDFHRVVDADDEVREHSRMQLIVGVRDLGTDGYPMRVRIDRLVDLRNLALETRGRDRPSP